MRERTLVGKELRFELVDGRIFSSLVATLPRLKAAENATTLFPGA
ncbi:MAG: hypothetical protein ACR2H0_04215 [Candidatus Limnocylindrales bacterium]